MEIMSNAVIEVHPWHSSTSAEVVASVASDVEVGLIAAEAAVRLVREWRQHSSVATSCGMVAGTPPIGRDVIARALQSIFVEPRSNALARVEADA